MNEGLARCTQSGRMSSAVSGAPLAQAPDFVVPGLFGGTADLRSGPAQPGRYRL